jgi:hypothetical protein
MTNLEKNEGKGGKAVVPKYEEWQVGEAAGIVLDTDSPRNLQQLY